jgi:adenine-specific DNA methylase
MNFVWILFGWLLFTPAADLPKMKKVKLTDNVTAQMPEEFRPMTDDEIAQRYFTYRKPVAMFTDRRAVVDFGLNTSVTTWNYEDLPILKSFYKASIMQMFTNVNMLKEEIEEVNGRKYAVFEFISEVRSEPDAIVKRAPKVSYTLLLYTVVGEKVYIINFTCPAEVRKEWRPVAQAMMKTVKIG